MPTITSKMWNGRKIKSEFVFNKSKDQSFDAVYAAYEWLHKNDYSYGSMDARGPNPIAIIKGKYNLPQKWHNFGKEDKAKIDGVIISSDWREGEVKVILFEEKIIF